MRELRKIKELSKDIDATPEKVLDKAEDALKNIDEEGLQFLKE